jgi:hypothetical protein
MKKWKMPTWMKQYERFIINTGGNDVTEMMNGDADPRINLPLSTLQACVKSQIGMLEVLHKHGALPDEINRFATGQTVKDNNGRIAKVTEVSWGVGYYLDDDPAEQIYQPDEIEAVK